MRCKIITGSSLCPHITPFLPLPCCPHVSNQTGIAGFTLGGGFGIISRRHGLATDQLLAVRAVLADGTFVEASADENPDLFWAMRGAGTSFAAAVAFKLALFPVSRDFFFLKTAKKKVRQDALAYHRFLLHPLRRYLPMLSFQAGDKGQVFGGVCFWNIAKEETFDELLQAYASVIKVHHENTNWVAHIFVGNPPMADGQRTLILQSLWLGNEPLTEAKSKLEAILHPLLSVPPMMNAMRPCSYAEVMVEILLRKDKEASNWYMALLSSSSRTSSSTLLPTPWRHKTCTGAFLLCGPPTLTLPSRL